MAFNGNINGRKKMISDVIDYKMFKDLQQKAQTDPRYLKP